MRAPPHTTNLEADKSPRSMTVVSKMTGHLLSRKDGDIEVDN